MTPAAGTSLEMVLTAPQLGGLSSYRRCVLTDPRDTQAVIEFEKALEGWSDHRFITSAELRTVAMFTLYLVNLAEHAGWVLRGHSWKESDHLGCLVVKAIVDGIPSVVFTNAKTLVGGMRIFLRKLEADFLEWVPDKYG